MAGEPILIIDDNEMNVTLLSHVLEHRGYDIRSAAPAPVLHTFGTQHPMLISTISAPIDSAMRAVSAMMSGSAPKI